MAPSVIELTILSGKPGSLSHAAPLRLTQMVLKPNAPAPEISQLFEEKKVTSLIKTINEEIKSVYVQIEEIYIKEAIPTEIGEEEMIRALDTTRMASSSFFEENLEKIDSTEQTKNKTEHKKTPFKRK